jgi:hypothetical protein
VLEGAENNGNKRGEKSTALALNLFLYATRKNKNVIPLYYLLSSKS